MEATARRAGLPSRGSPEALDRATGNTRTLIEETAIALFYESGSQVSSVRDITKACGMTPGALYKHFDSKEDLLFEVIRSAHEHFLGRLDEALGITHGASPEVRLSALVRALVLFHTDHRREARVANQEYRFLPEPQQHVVLQLRRDIRARFHDVLAAGEQEGIFRLPATPGSDPAALAAVTICDMGMRVSEWYDGAHPPSAAELATLHTTYALRLVGATD
jgi:AcrR family transcriptional regulator